MLVAAEVKGELARIHPARECCRRAELLGLFTMGARRGELRTLDHATARTAVHLATSLGIPIESSASSTAGRRHAGARHHLRLRLGPFALGTWSWDAVADHDRRAFLRGVFLATGSFSLGSGGPHVELVMHEPMRGRRLRRWLHSVGVRALIATRRGRVIVYLKGQEEIVTLLRLVGANRGVTELETERVDREVRSRLNRLLNAEEANLGRTVRAADRQLRAIEALDEDGRLQRLSTSLREAAAARRRHPEGDLDSLAAALGVSRSAANHRLRRLVELAE